MAIANTPLVLTGAPLVTTTATQSSPAGSYPITPSIGTLASINYTFAFVPGVMVINGTPGYIVTCHPECPNRSDGPGPADKSDHPSGQQLSGVGYL